MTPASSPDAQTPSVTVCLPTTGRLEFLSDALESLRAQTLPPTEVLVLDNASPPEAQRILNEFAASDARVRVLRVDQRVSMFHNFNRGFAAATGTYVAYLHDDDIYEPAFLQQLIDILERNPNVGFAGSNCTEIDEQGAVIRVRRLISRTHIAPGQEFIRHLIGEVRSPLPTPGAVYRRAAFPATPFDESLSVHYGDCVVFMRAAEQCDVALLEEPLIRVRQHGHNASAIPLLRAISIRRDQMEAYCDEYRDRHPEREIQVRRMRASIRRAHAKGMLWAWASASDRVDAAACLQEAARCRVARSLVVSSQLAERAWPASPLRRRFMAHLARAAGLRMA